MPGQSDSYVYSIVPSADLNTRIMHLAVARQADLRSYVGEVVAMSHDKTVSIVCESQQPSQNVPLIPDLMNGLLVCASNSKEIK